MAEAALCTKAQEPEPFLTASYTQGHPVKLDLTCMARPVGEGKPEDQMLIISLQKYPATSGIWVTHRGQPSTGGGIGQQYQPPRLTAGWKTDQTVVLPRW